MFVKKDLRKVHEILADPEDERTEIKLFRRKTEFEGRGVSILFREEYKKSFDKLKYLSLYGNHLTHLDGIELLKDSPLERLNLGDNELAELQEEFRELKQIKQLWLDDNFFKEFPGALLGMKNLECLCFSGNMAESIPPEIRTLSALQTLSLNNNALESLPPSIGRLSRLCHLDISGNQITQLPSSIGDLLDLRTLIASSNAIVQLPDSFKYLLNLTKLRLNKNDLEKIPQFVVDLFLKDKLRYLNVANNRLVQVPPALYAFLPDGIKETAEREQTRLPEPIEFPAESQVILIGNPKIQVGIPDVAPKKKSRVEVEAPKK